MSIKLSWIGGATWVLETHGLRIACDPCLCAQETVQDYGFFKSRRLEGPALGPGDLQGVEVWLLTHHHEDHLDAEGLSRLAAGASIICPSRLSALLRKRGLDSTPLHWGHRTVLERGPVTLEIRAVPAIHARNRILGALVGNGNGYVVAMQKAGRACSLYVTGDDVFSPRRATRFLPPKLDLVIANAGAAHVGRGLLGRLVGRITNGNADLELIEKTLRPAVVIPVHWGTFEHYLEVPPPAFRRLTPGGSIELPLL